MSFGTNAPEGFVENKSKISATDNSQFSRYDIASGYATSLFTGDPLTLAANGYINRAIVGGPVCGVFKGVEYISAANGDMQWFPYWVASTAVKDSLPARAYVIDDPFVVFTIQVGGAGPSQATRANINQNANFSLGAGSTFSGVSGVFLDITTAGSDATKSCKILAITLGFTAAMNLPPKNVLSQDYNNVDVIFNNHQFKGGTGTLAV